MPRYSVEYTVCDAFQALSWSACCVFITLRPLRTQRAREIACSAFMNFDEAWNVFIKRSRCIHDAMPSNYARVHIVTLRPYFRGKNSLAWCQRVARRVSSRKCLKIYREFSKNVHTSHDLKITYGIIVIFDI